MAAKKTPVKKPVKKKKPIKVRIVRRCIVCLVQTDELPHSQLCEDCDLDYGVALAAGVGTIEWAVTLAQAMFVARFGQPKGAPKVPWTERPDVTVPSTKQRYEAWARKQRGK